MEWAVVALGMGFALPTVPLVLVGWSARRRARATLVVAGFPPGLVARRAEGPEVPTQVATGDPEFEALIRLEGDLGRWLRHLTPDVRSALVQLVPLGLELRAGRVGGSVDGVAREVLEGAVVRLRDAFDAAPATIAERFASEPSPAVRRRLLSFAVDGPERGEVLARAAADPDPAVRLLGAEARGDADALVGIVTDPAAAPALQELAFTALRRGYDAEAIALRLLEVTGPEARLARERLTSLPPGPWVDLVVVRLLTRAEGTDVLSTALGLLHALPEIDGRARLREVLAALPESAARDLIPRVPARLLSREVVADTERARPSLGVLLRTTFAVHHTNLDGPDLRDAAGIYTGSVLRWRPEERRAVGTSQGRTLSATPGVGGTLFRLHPVPLGARLSITVRPSGERVTEVPGTAPALSWFPRQVRGLLRDALPPCDALQVEDGEVRLRATPESGGDVERIVDVLQQLAAALDALGPLTDVERVTAAFRTAEPGAVRRKLAAGAFAADAALAGSFVSDEDPEVRRAAARHAPHPPTLVALVADRALPLPVRTVALSDLQSLDDRAALSAAVRHAWDEMGLVHQAIVATGAARLRDQWDQIVRLVDRLAPPAAPARLLEQEIVVKALLVLFSLEEPASEPTVLRALTGRDPTVRRGAIAALGAIGTPATIRALQAHGARTPPERALVDQAIAHLRARVGTGALAIAEAPGGTLAVASGGGTLAAAVGEPESAHPEPTPRAPDGITGDG